MPNRIQYHSVFEIQHTVLSIIASTCELPIEEIPKDEPILTLGIDSMIAANISHRIEQNFGIILSFAELTNDASIVDLAYSIYRQINQIEPHDLKQAKRVEVPEAIVDSKNDFDDIAALHKKQYDIRSLQQYKKINLQKILYKKAQIELPYYRVFNSSSTDTIQFENRELINFSSYNYLGFNHDPRVNLAAEKAISKYGTSASSSRIVSGEKCIHQDLERAIAELYQVEDALVFVSGYATNVSVISHLMDRNDLIVHDSLAHNSIVMGSQFSQAKRLKFPHNDLAALEAILKENRLLYERVLIVVEGLYSMDGDIAPLAQLIALKKRYKCLLMVDEAHSMGVLGDRGFGLSEHLQVPATDVDIWMGTLSKTFAGCGGYIAGCAELIDYLKFSAPGLIFSVGMSPPLAGASLKAIELLHHEPQRVKQLQENSQYFLSLAQQKGFNTGLAEGYAIIPIIIGHSLNTARLTNFLFRHGINAQSIIYPGVEELSARLRFFISALHSKEQIQCAITILDSYYLEQHEMKDEHCRTTS